MKYLINNADDFGWGPDITQGIIDSHKNGVLSSASVIISEIDDESLKLIKSHNGLGLGLHLNIATGKAVSETWDKKYGLFEHPVRKTALDFYSQEQWNETYGKFETGDIYKEFESQLTLFKKLIGKMPDHIDTHYNTFSVRSVFDAYLKLAQKYSLPMRQPVGYRRSKDGDNFVSKTSELIPVPEFIKEIKNNSIVTTTYFSPEYINLHEDYVHAILSEMDKVKDGESVEISYHPGYREEWRRKQVEILTDPLLKEALREASVKVINYTDLYESSHSFLS